MKLASKQFDKIFSENSFQINNHSFTFKYGNFMHLLEMLDYHPLTKNPRQWHCSSTVLLLEIDAKSHHDICQTIAWLIANHYSTKAEMSSERHAIIAKWGRIAHPCAIFVFQKLQKLLHAALNGQADKNVFSQKFHYIPLIVRYFARKQYFRGLSAVELLK